MTSPTAVRAPEVPHPFDLIADGIARLGLGAAATRGLAGDVHDMLVDMCWQFAVDRPNLLWVLRASGTKHADQGTSASDLIADGIARAPMAALEAFDGEPEPAREWLAARVHDALADSVDGFASGSPNRNWLRRCAPAD